MRYSAFTFIEVLFAVILLGIGFIMIAGVFPVAMQQSAAVFNETQGNAVIHDAIKKIQAVADQPGASSLFSPCVSGGVVAPILQPIGGNLMTALGSEFLYSADKRYAWMAFYRRDSASAPFAQIFVIALENPNFPNYLANPATQPSGSIDPQFVPPLPQNRDPNNNTYENAYGYGPYWLPAGTYAGEPAPTATVTLNYNTATGQNSVIFPTYMPNAAPGAFLLVCDDETTPPTPGTTTGTVPVLNGRFFKLDQDITTTAPGTAQTFTLVPGYDLQPAPATPAGATSPDLTNLNNAGNKSNQVKVYMVGRAPILNPTSGIANDYSGPFTGPNQDIAAGSAFIRINTANN